MSDVFAAHPVSARFSHGRRVRSRRVFPTRSKPATGQSGFATGAALALLVVFMVVFGELALRRLADEIKVLREYSLTTTTLSHVEAQHRFVCRRIASGEFPDILANHTQARLESAAGFNNAPLLANGIDPLGEDAHVFFNVVYLFPTPPVTFNAADFQTLPPQARLLVDEYNRFKNETLIHLRYVTTVEHTPDSEREVPFSYIVEATVKTKITSVLSRSFEGVGRQDHQSRFILTITPERPRNGDLCPRRFYTPPYPALFPL